MWEGVRAGELGEPAGDLYLEGEALSRMHRHPLHQGAERRHKIDVAAFRPASQRLARGVEISPVAVDRLVVDAERGAVST